MIKLVVSDLDGTMFGKDCIVPEQAPKLVRQLHEKGILFTIASGRAEWMIEPIARQLGVVCPYVACNGGTIIKNGQALRRMQFPVRLVRETSALADHLGISVVYTINGQERVTTCTPWMETDTAPNRGKYLPQPFTELEWESLLVEKVMYYDPEYSGLIARIDALLSEENSVSHVRYRNRAVEVTEKSVNKATGLLSLLDLLQLDASEAMVIADDQNDIEILKLAGIGVAVANATPDAKSAADYVCAGEQFSGIQEAVRRFCMEEAG